MTDTLWADISEFQLPVNDRYPYNVLELRSNDGTHLDQNFSQNIGWATRSKLNIIIVYYFYRPGANGAGVLMNRVGKPDDRMVAMIDVEGAGGQVTGNQSAQINGEFNALANWIGSPKRVIGYGNVGDLNALWPQKPPGIRLIVAAYGSNPGYPGKFAHQFADNYRTPPFGSCDINSADGMSVADLQQMFGMTHQAPPPPQGPYSHMTDGTGDINAIAKSRNMRTLPFIDMQDTFNKPDDAQNLVGRSTPKTGSIWFTPSSEHRLTDGKTTIADIAASQSMTPLNWVDLQYKLHPENGDTLVGGAVPSAGTRYWTNTL